MQPKSILQFLLNVEIVMRDLCFLAFGCLKLCCNKVVMVAKFLDLWLLQKTYARVVKNVISLKIDYTYLEANVTTNLELSDM